MQKTVTLAYLLSPSPVLLSHVYVLQDFFSSRLTVFGFFDRPMIFFFFFVERKLCNWRANSSKAWQSIDLHSAPHAPSLLASKKPTLQEKSRKLAYWQDRNLSRRTRARMSIKCIAWLRSVQPFLFLTSRISRAQNLSSRFFFLMSQDETKKKKKKIRWTRVWFLFRFCKWCDCLVWIDFCRFGERSVAIHSPHTLPASKITQAEGLALFSFPFFWRRTLVVLFWLFII